MAVPTTRRRPSWPIPAVLRSLLVLLGVVAMPQAASAAERYRPNPTGEAGGQRWCQ